MRTRSVPYFLATALALVLASPGLAADPAEFKVDTSSSTLKWLGKKVTGQHNGTIQIKRGQLKVIKNAIVNGDFAVDMTSIKVEDLKDPEYNTKLVNHLKSDDFFSVAKHQEATFAITEVKARAKAKQGEPTHDVTGQLTIKGITHPITFPATIEVKNGQVTARAKFKVDRTKYEVRYGSGKFFENLGDKMIYDDFELELDLSAKS